VICRQAANDVLNIIMDPISIDLVSNNRRFVHEILGYGFEGRSYW
jgi:hypothetical protein